LKAREGTLAELPFPLLLHSLMVEERTCLVELKVRQLEKRLSFEEGSPVACASNLLHETLGQFLIARGKLTESQHQKTLNDSVQTGVQYGEMLVRQSLITPFDLYKQLQANLALKILDCFRWGEARYRVVQDAEPSKSPIKMNPLRLVYTGTANFSPFETVASHLMFADEQRFALVPNPAHDLDDVKLTAKDTRLVQALRGRPTFAEILDKGGFDTEQAMRRLYALCVMGLCDFAEAVQDAPAAPAPVAAPVTAPVTAPAPVLVAPAPPAGVPFADDDDAMKNELAQAFLEHRKKDPFDLLGVTEAVQLPALRKAFLALADRYSPVRFRSGDLREKAESLLAALGRAYGQLVEPDSFELHRKRRLIAAESRKSGTRPSTAEQFKIKTELLDASSQFEEGKRRLAAGAHRQAVEYFEYAVDIQPAALHQAYLALARFKLNPNTGGEACLRELAEAARAEPECELAWAFAGDIQAALGKVAAAEESYRRAFKANPGNRRYPDLIRDLSRVKKK
jgi:hypothetical protein